MKSVKENKVNRIHLLEEFNASPNSVWFGQENCCCCKKCSEATVERDRWSGGGIPFIKCGRSVRLQAINFCSGFQSTSQLNQPQKHNNKIKEKFVWIHQ